MSDILFDDIPVEQQETVVGGDNYYSFSSNDDKEFPEKNKKNFWKKYGLKMIPYSQARC